MNISEMRQILAEDDIQLTKSLGQNFLHDGNQLRRIADAAALSKQDKVLEIGPGLGPLTEVLLERADKVLAIEKDERLVEVLHRRFAEAEQRGVIQLLHDDALEYLQRGERNWTGWKLVANLPYSVASPILVELAQTTFGPDRLVATLQIEVAKRLMARHDEDDYGLLTLLVQFDYEPGGWFKIPASCFFPEPEVDSACVCLTRRTKPLLPAEARPAFMKVVRRGFSQRRKMMFKLLKCDWPVEKLERAFAETGLSVQIRAEAVSLEGFAALTQALLHG
jgi:16S rRNA (adenine1518-N6/adenine1519-N6)-dimethyltransferase